MMPPPKVFSFDGVVPVIDPSAFVHPSAVLIGNVVVGPRCYVGPLASLRGDFGRIILEAGSNLQDSCVMHSFPGQDAIIEADGHVGHGAILHGCRVGRNALIGMNSVIMDKAEIGENSFVSACAFVKSGMKVPANSLVAGVPAELMRGLTEGRSSGRARFLWRVRSKAVAKSDARAVAGRLGACNNKPSGRVINNHRQG